MKYIYFLQKVLQKLYIQKIEINLYYRFIVIYFLQKVLQKLYIQKIEINLYYRFIVII